MKPKATSWPTPAAMRVERFASPVTHQTTARRTRPPSSGNPGIMLKMPRAMLMTPNHMNMAAGGEPVPTAKPHPNNHASTRQTIPIAILVIGPIMPIQNSDFASAASFSICATPPKAKSVIARTGIPRSFATAACESSCNRIETKNKSPVMIAIVQVVGAPQSG